MQTWTNHYTQMEVEEQPLIFILCSTSHTLIMTVPFYIPCNVSSHTYKKKSISKGQPPPPPPPTLKCYSLWTQLISPHHNSLLILTNRSWQWFLPSLSIFPPRILNCSHEPLFFLVSHSQRRLCKRLQSEAIDIVIVGIWLPLARTLGLKQNFV